MTAIRLDDCTAPQRRLILALRAAAEAARVDRETMPAETEGAGADGITSSNDPAVGRGDARTNEPPFAAKHATLRRAVETAPTGSSVGAVEEIVDDGDEPPRAA